MNFDIVCAILIIFILFCVFCYCKEESYKNYPIKKPIKGSIKKIQIFGERNTGSNYLEKLVRINFPEIEISWEEGWKHWQDSELFDPNNNYIGDSNTLFLLIVRNPYDWLRSMKNKPHHIENPSDNFSEFIREKQNTVHLDNIRNIDTNIISLRNRKNKGNRVLLNKVVNSKLIKYEELVKDPQKIMDSINNIVNEVNYKFKPYNLVVGPAQGKTNKNYKKPKFEDINKEDINFINNNLDWTLEHYSKKF